MLYSFILIVVFSCSQTEQKTPDSSGEAKVKVGKETGEISSNKDNKDVSSPIMSFKAFDFSNFDFLVPISSADKDRIKECQYMGPRMSSKSFEPNPALDFFNENSDDQSFNGFMMSNGDALLLSMHNFQSKPEVLYIGLRGLDEGIHSSPISSRLLERTSNQNTTVVLPDPYYIRTQEHGLEQSQLVSMCMERLYPEKRFVEKKWPQFDSGNAWNFTKKLFEEINEVVIVSHVNGAAPRNQFLELDKNIDKKVPYDYTPTDLKNFISNYKFIHPEVDKITGLVDIETNYRTDYNLMILAMFLKTKVMNDESKFYQSACNSRAVTTIENHLRLIKMLELKGTRLENGVIRYSNEMGNIQMDIIGLKKNNDIKVNEVAMNKYAPYKDMVVSGFKQLTLNSTNVVKYGIDEYLTNSKND